MHLLSGVPEPAPNSEAATTKLPEAAAFAAIHERNARIEQLEDRLARVESELEQMRVTFAAFREQFD
jgi:uncharacterized protein YceH (UPF0502 family)